MRWPWTRTGRSSGHDYDDPRDCDGIDIVACTFCGEVVHDTATDPIEIRVVDRTPPGNDSMYWSVYGHRACFVATFTTKDVPGIWGDPDDWRTS